MERSQTAQYLQGQIFFTNLEKYKEKLFALVQKDCLSTITLWLIKITNGV